MNNAANGKMGKRSRKDCLIKIVHCRKMGERGREVIDWLVERMSKCKVGKMRGHIINRHIEAKSIQSKMGERRGKSVH